ncbi:MAG: 3-deoxy-manno-octulosonate cytidylyltransferase [Rhodobacteraceae bacterium]|nr:3-deoxy-manno-octulosonate cytidylyltransferase [Paracoccaceae bacterium]
MVVVVIPARFQSQRFEGKPLAMLRGVTGAGKSLIQRSWEAGCAVPDVARVIVATDDIRIFEHAKSFGAEVMMTSPAAANGTERCAEVAAKLDDAELIVNLQGDAPLTPPDFVSAVIAAMEGEEMATPVLRCDAKTLKRHHDDRKAGRIGGTTAVFDRQGSALYFSKELLPFTDNLAAGDAVFHHVGLYAYRAETLRRYTAWPAGPLERIEGLEQLRFLENGVGVRCVEVAAKGRDFWEVNNPVDIERVEKALAEMGVE